MLQFGKRSCFFKLNLKYLGCEKKPVRLLTKNLNESNSLISSKTVSSDIIDSVK